CRPDATGPPARRTEPRRPDRSAAVERGRLPRIQRQRAPRRAAVAVGPDSSLATRRLGVPLFGPLPAAGLRSIGMGLFVGQRLDRRIYVDLLHVPLSALSAVYQTVIDGGSALLDRLCALPRVGAGD